MKLDKIKFKKTDGLTKFLVKRGQLFHISILGGGCLSTKMIGLELLSKSHLTSSLWNEVIGYGLLVFSMFFVISFILTLILHDEKIINQKKIIDDFLKDYIDESKTKE